MDVLYLREAEVERLLTMEMALDAVEAGFRALADGRARNHPRQRLRLPGTVLLHYMAALDAGSGYLGVKLYTSSPAGVRFLVLLYEKDTGALVAVLEADTLGRMRTGATTGVASKYLARPDASAVGILGTGHQAPTQLLALSQVRGLKRIRAYSRNRERRRAFAERMTARLGLPVEPTETPEAAVREAEIVVVVTTAREPVLRGAWLASGTHINAVGVNVAQKREIDEEVLARAARIVVDSREQSLLEAGDLLIPWENQPERWQAVGELSEVVTGRSPGRESPAEITLFKSNGLALEDVVTAARVYERARREGVGQWLPLWTDNRPG